MEHVKNVHHIIRSTVINVFTAHALIKEKLPRMEDVYLVLCTKEHSIMTEQPV